MSRVRLRLPLPHRTSPEQLAAIVAPLMGFDPARLAHEWARDGVARSDALRPSDADLLAKVLVSFNVVAEREVVRSAPVERLDPALAQSSVSTINGMEGALLQRALAYLEQADHASADLPFEPTSMSPPPLAPETLSDRPLVFDLPLLAAVEVDETDDLRTLVDPPKGLAAPAWARPTPRPRPAPRPAPRRPAAPLEHPARAIGKAARIAEPPAPVHRATQPAAAMARSSDLVDRRLTLLFWLLCVLSATLGCLALVR